MNANDDAGLKSMWFEAGERIKKMAFLDVAEMLE